MTTDFDAIYAIVYPKLYELALKRAGYFSDLEGERSGLRPALRDEALARGGLVRVADGLLRVAILPRSAQEAIFVTWFALGTRGVVSHRSALALQDLCPPDDALHFSYPLDEEAEGLVAPPGVVLHYAEVPITERVWPFGITTTNAQRALDDCERAGLDAGLLAAARDLAARRKLIVVRKPTAQRGSGSPAVHAPPPAIPDLALRLALLEELATLPRAVYELDAETLRAWVDANAIPPERLPLHEVRWRRSSALFRALPAAHDGAIRDLSSLPFYSALRVVDLRESRVKDLAPLAALLDLEVLHIGLAPDADLAPLERCAALKRVRLDGLVAERHAPARERLEARGVQVDLVAGEARASSAPFADPVIKLAVLEALSNLGAIELPSLVAIDGYELDRENLDRLLAVPLSPEQLARVVELYWEVGGVSIIEQVWPQFDGESDEFDVRSLGGLEHLPKLRTLRIAYAVARDELEPDLLDALRARGVRVEIT